MLLHHLRPEQVKTLFAKREPEKSVTFKIVNPKNRKSGEIKHSKNTAFLPPEEYIKKAVAKAVALDDVHFIGGMPVRITKDLVQIPRWDLVADLEPFRPWLPDDWKLWRDLTKGNCKNVPWKPGVVSTPVTPYPRMVQVSEDCARAYTVSHLGVGNVVNVITQALDASFTVQPNPSPNPPYPSNLPATEIVHPFAKGGINHKYRRLYVPASFYSAARQAQWGGFYVAVVDIDPCSSTYLDTISWIDCGWIPEEVSFSDDNEIGVITNYMQGTATIFDASTGSILEAEVDLFPNAGNLPGDALNRSVRCADVPGVGNRAFVTLTDNAPEAGVAIINLDAAGFPVTNFTHPSFGFIDGLAVTPEKDHVLLVESSAKLHVVRVDTGPSLVRTIDLPAGGGQSYFGGIDVRPSGNMCFIATGRPDGGPAGGGTTLIQVGYHSPYVIEMPTGLPEQTWDVRLRSIGNPLKPHIFVCSTSGSLSIIPC